MKHVLPLFALAAVLALLTACAGKNGSGTETGDTSVQSVDQPAFSLTQAPLKVSCDGRANLNFIVSEGLNDKNVYMLARFAMVGTAALPFDPNSLPKWLQNAGFSKTKLLVNTPNGVSGFAAISPKMNIVVFRGTHSPEGMATNLKFIVSSALGSLSGGVHGGFAQAYKSVSASLGEMILAQAQKSVPTYYIGHSLGGALATLAALDMQKQGNNVQGLVTIGQPRVGNTQFAAQADKSLAGKVRRLVHKTDPVPHLPPTKTHGDHVFASLLGGAAQAAAQFAGFSFKGLNFTHMGNPIVLGNPEFSGDNFDSDDAWDGRYWKQHTSALGSVLMNPSALMQSELIKQHMVEPYLCELAKRIK